jgi:hypothetical protein
LIESHLDHPSAPGLEPDGHSFSGVCLRDAEGVACLTTVAIAGRASQPPH